MELSVGLSSQKEHKKKLRAAHREQKQREEVRLF
jgi:hypothetical protein